MARLLLSLVVVGQVVGQQVQAVGQAGRQVGKVRRVVERPNCQVGETVVYPDPASCNNFMLCENGTVSLKL